MQWWFLPYFDINQPWVYVCPPSQTPLPPPSLSHPAGLSQCTDFDCPVSFVKLGLVNCFTYGNIHVSMLFSQIISPSSSPTESKSNLLYICISFAVSHTGSSFSSDQFSHSVMSDFLQPYESQHARPPCPSPTPGVHSNSCPSSR